MAYIINPSNKTQLMVDGTTKTEVSTTSVLVSAQADLADLPADLVPGSLAYTPGFTHVWQKDFANAWVEVSLQ